MTQQAIAANNEVSTLVRTPSKLPAEAREIVTVHQADLATTSASALAAILQHYDVVINTAGRVTDGQVFVDLVARISSASARLHWTGEYCVRGQWSINHLWVSIECGYRSTDCPYKSPRSPGFCPERW